MNQMELNDIFNKIYDLKGGETLEFTSKGGLRYVITKDYMYGDKEYWKQTNPELTNEELSDLLLGNVLVIEAYEGDKPILSLEGVHVVLFDVESFYEDDAVLFDEHGQEFTGKEWLALQEEKEI